VLDLADADTVISRTEGVTASFMKELLRRAALRTADEQDPETDAGEPLRVTDAHLTAALDQLLDTRNELTRILLGGTRAPAKRPRASGGGSPHPSSES
jgi:hypothetical protein